MVHEDHGLDTGIVQHPRSQNRNTVKMSQRKENVYLHSAVSMPIFNQALEERTQSTLYNVVQNKIQTLSRSNERIPRHNRVIESDNGFQHYQIPLEKSN